VNARDYDKMVSVGILRRLAEAEAGLLATAEERDATAERLSPVANSEESADANAAQREVFRCQQIAETLRDEAKLVRKRALKFLVEEVEKQKEPSADDLRATLEHAFKGANLSKYEINRLALVMEKLRLGDIRTAHSVLTENPWPTGVRQAYLDLVIEELLRKMMEEKRY